MNIGEFATSVWQILWVAPLGVALVLLFAIYRATRSSPLAVPATTEPGRQPQGTDRQNRDPSSIRAQVPYRDTPKAAVHRYPPGILEKPERYRAEDIAAFCKERAGLAQAGEALYVELYKVSIHATHKDDLAWQSRMEPWLRACKQHHQRFWQENFNPLLRARTQATIPVWRGTHQDTIQKRLQWLREYGWGCDE